MDRPRLCCSVGPSSDSHFILPPLDAFLTLGVWQSGDTSCSLLAVQKDHVTAYTTGPTYNHRIAAWIPLFRFLLFFEQPSSLFLSFSTCDFPPFETASFPWISPSLHISTSIKFPLFGLMTLSLSNPQSFVPHFSLLTSYSQSSRHFTLLCLTLSTVQKKPAGLKEQEVT